MSGSPPKRRAAKRISRREVTATIEAPSEYEGWSITIYADFSARLLADLQSGDVARILGFLNAVVRDHNLPNDAGEIASDLGDVDYQGLLKVAEAAMEAIQRLPPR